MGEEDLLEMAEALDKVEGLSSEDEKFLERVMVLLRDEKRLSRKDRDRLLEMHKDMVGEKEKPDPDVDPDEDDFM